jgi:transcriptional regulator with XRE-family HTH domain
MARTSSSVKPSTKVAQPANMNRYEQGVHQASIEVVHQLAKALEVPTAYFYTDDDDLALVLFNWERIDPDLKKTLLASLKADE